MTKQQEQDDTDYVVFGAGGPTGLHVLETLVKLGYKVKAVVRKPEEHGEITHVSKKLDEKPFDNSEIKLVKGDVSDLGSVMEACKGARGAFFTASGKGYFSASAVDYKGVANVAAAAKEHGLERVVVISSAFVSPHRYLHPIRIILNSIRFRLMDYKFKGEEALRRSGVPYTVIRPGRLMDSRAEEAPWEISQGDISAGGGGVARADIARIAVAAMLSPDAAFTTFEVFGAAVARKVEPAELMKTLQKDARAGVSAGAAGEEEASSTSGGSGVPAESSGSGAETKKAEGGGVASSAPPLPEQGGIVNMVWRTLVMLP